MKFPEMQPSKGAGKAAPRPTPGRASVELFAWRNAMRKSRKTSVFLEQLALLFWLQFCFSACSWLHEPTV